MKILFITHKYPPVIGGMEKQSYELTTRAALDHDVITHAYIGDGSKLMWFLSLKKRVKTILQENPDIQLIHLNDGLMAAATLWLKNYTDIPVVATVHGLDITFPSTIFQNKIVKKMHRLDGVICVSNATADACRDREFEASKVFTVLNGVDHDLAKIEREENFLKRVMSEKGVDLSEKKVIMTMGRAVKRKGFSWFLEHVVPNLDDDIVFLMVGPLNKKVSFLERIVNALPQSIGGKIQLMFGMATDVKAIVAALEDDKLGDRVYHMGKVSFKDLMQYLSIAHLFVMPNIRVDGDAEGFGLVALEASLRGAPVVAAGIEGITDAVHDGENGILLPSGNAQAWIQTLNSTMADDEKLVQLSKKTVSYTLDHYGWDKMVAEYLEVFEVIVNQGKNNK